MSVSLEDTIAHRQHNWLSSTLNRQAVWVLCAIVVACIFLSFATDAFAT
jgi:ribose transport system permease protein